MVQFKQVTTLTETVEELSLANVEPEKKLQTARQIHGDMPLIDRYTNEVKKHTKDVSINLIHSIE